MQKSQNFSKKAKKPIVNKISKKSILDNNGNKFLPVYIETKLHVGRTLNLH